MTNLEQFLQMIVENMAEQFVRVIKQMQKHCSSLFDRNLV